MRNKIPNKDERRREDSPDNESCWWLLASLFMAAMMGLIMVSCDWDDSRLSSEAEEGLPATIQLEVTPDAATQAQTRADENAIKDIHVLVYNSKGELKGKSYGTSSKLTVKTRSGNGNKIYAIANTGSATLFDGIVATTEAGLKTMKTAALDSWDGLATATHLMMVGSKTGVSINAGSSTLSGGISVERMVAKATLNISVKGGSGITIKDYQVFLLPKQSYYVSNTTAATAYMNGAQIMVNATTANKTFLMYENLRGVNNDIKYQEDKGESKAPKNSTYVVINGEANGYKATWRVYLGENETSDFNMKRNCQYTYNITLNRPGTDGTDTRVEVEETCPVIVGGNSNCYMVKPGSAITIPVERANESPIELTGSTLYNGTYYQLQSSTTWAASLIWESSIGLVTLSDDTGIGPSGRFKVTAANTSGNAVVAIKNNNDEILWSWHIWVTTYDGIDRFTNHNGERDFIFMDRALGATSPSAVGELTSCGLMYQWGRKDPFPGIGQEGGYWTIPLRDDPIKVYNASGDPLCPITKTTVPNVTPNNLTHATRNPNTFYCNATSPYDWFVYNSSSDQNNDLWSGGDINQGTTTAKSVFDPCPAGWRVPPLLAGISPFTGMTTSNGRWVNYGRTWSGTGGHFPASGYRDSSTGGLFYVSANGCYWSGSSSGIYGSHSYFSSKEVEPAFGSQRATGFPLRCSQDTITP